MRRIPMLLILLPVLSSTQAAYGHAMHVQCRVVSPDHVVVDASWGRDEPVAQAAVTVFDANGDAMLRGTTDATGRFEFTVAEPQALIVEVVFAGHRGECEVRAAAFEGAAVDTAAEDPLLLESAMGEDDDHQHDHAHGEPHEHAHDGEYAHAADAHSHDHAHDQGHEHSHVAELDHKHHGTHDHDSEAGSHGHKGDSHAHDDAHAADDDHRAELIAGIALILSAASFLMVLSLRREVKSLVETSRGNRS